MPLFCYSPLVLWLFAGQQILRLKVVTAFPVTSTIHSSGGGCTTRLCYDYTPAAWGFVHSRMLGILHENSGHSDSEEDSGDDGDHQTGGKSDEILEEDVESSRERFERLLALEIGSSNNGTVQPRSKDKTSIYQQNMDSIAASTLQSVLSNQSSTVHENPPPPPLTALQRARREAEMRMLKRLEDGDEALSDLWMFWFQERGPDAAARLLRAEVLVGRGPSAWPEAEQSLKDMIELHSVNWVEPLNRLATLYFLQRRFEESAALCKIVLSLKPWHFGALSGIVLVYTHLGDADAIRFWAKKRLPTNEPTSGTKDSLRRRKEWVQWAIGEARSALLTAEQRLGDSMFGVPDDHVIYRQSNTAQSGKSQEDDKGAWQ